MDLKKCENCIHIFRDSYTFKLNSRKNTGSKKHIPKTCKRLWNGWETHPDAKIEKTCRKR